MQPLGELSGQRRLDRAMARHPVFSCKLRRDHRHRKMGLALRPGSDMARVSGAFVHNIKRLWRERRSERRVDTRRAR